MTIKRIKFLKDEQDILKELIKKDMISGTTDMYKLERIMVKLK